MNILKSQLGNLFHLKYVATAALLLTSTGCWQEIRYEPTAESSDPPRRPVVLREEAKPAEDELPASPSGEQLFAEEPASKPAASPEQEDSLWNGLDSEPDTTTVDQPAPPAKLDWLDEPPSEQQTTADLPEQESAPAQVDPRTALAVWRMASKWSLAAGVYGKGWPEERYQDIWQQAEFAAELIDLQLPSLPDGVAEDKLLSTSTSFLLEEAGPELTAEVAGEYRALCELAVNTHALLLFYSPTDERLPALITSIRTSAEDSSLPDRLWNPVLRALDERAEFPQVKQAVFDLHRQTADYLADLVSR